jgi:hypothetical protein
MAAVMFGALAIISSERSRNIELVPWYDTRKQASQPGSIALQSQGNSMVDLKEKAVLIHNISDCCLLTILIGGLGITRVNFVSIGL